MKQIRTERTLPPLTVDIPKKEHQDIVTRRGLHINVINDDKEGNYVVMVVGPDAKILWQYRSPFQKVLQRYLSEYLEKYDKDQLAELRCRRSDAVHVKTKQKGKFVVIATKVCQEDYDEFTTLVTLQGKSKHEVIRSLVKDYISRTKILNS